MGLPMLYNLAILVGISIIIRIGASFRHVASVILVNLRVLASAASLFRLRIPCILRTMGRLSAKRLTTGYGILSRRGRNLRKPTIYGRSRGIIRAPPNPEGGRSGPPTWQLPDPWGTRTDWDF